MQQTLRQALLEKVEVEEKIVKLEEQSKKLDTLCDLLKAEIAALKK